MKSKSTRSTKLLIVTLAVFISLIILLSFLSIQLAKSNLSSERSNYLEELGSKNSELLNAELTYDLRLVQATSTAIAQQDRLDIPSISSTLKELSTINNFDEVGIILPDNTIYTATHDTNTIKTNYPFKDLPTNAFISDMFWDTEYGEAILISYPIIQNSVTTGVLFAIKTATDLTTDLHIEDSGSKANCYVIKKNGAPILRSDTTGNLGDFDNLFNAITKLEKDPQASQILQSNLSKDQNGSLIINKKIKPKYLSYNKVGINDWYIVTIIPEEILSSNPLIQRLTYSLLLIIGISLIFSYIIVATSISYNKQLELIAYTDDVTGYGNFNNFKQCCNKLIKNNPYLNYAVVAFDINQFKVINDIYGHDIGNTVLKHIAKVLSTLVSEKECFGRIGADNFSLLLTYNEDTDVIYRLQAISTQVSGFIDGYIIGLSYGICRITEPNPEVSVLCDRASIAKSSIKNSIGVNYAFFNKSRRNELIREKEIENLMESALANREFICYLQPQFRLDNDEIFGAEALVRWNKPGKGIISPGEFIPVFEKNGFIKKLDYYMFEQVCILLNKWKRTNPSFFPLIISVNLSRLHLSTPTLCQDLLAITKKYMVEPSNIEIELTESAVYEDAARMIQAMRSLKSHGFILAIDDFGSGYSSLNTLKDIPADVLKLDKGFLEQSVNNKRGSHIITSLIDMAKSMGIMTIAEGVENSHHVRFLRQAGCDVAQGYYYSKPLPPEIFEEQLASLSLGKTSLNTTGKLF